MLLKVLLDDGDELKLRWSVLFNRFGIATSLRRKVKHNLQPTIWSSSTTRFLGCVSLSSFKNLYGVWHK